MASLGSLSYVAENLVCTQNKMGYAMPFMNEYLRAFLDFSDLGDEPVLDIGAAYGFAAREVLKRGGRVIANDLCGDHLAYLNAQVGVQSRNRLHLKVGHFPGDLFLQPNSVQAILASQVFHFLTGEEIELGVHKMYDWLMPGGRVFILAGTPYTGGLEKFIPVYEKRKEENHPWPGEIKNILAWTESFWAKNLPLYMNFLDVDLLSKAFKKVGFVIKKCAFLERIDFPESIRFDGRENVGMIAEKI